MLTAWDATAGKPREVPASEAIAIGLPILAWDEEKEEHYLVSAASLAEGMFAYARTLPAGSVHRGEVERQALEITWKPKAERKKKAAKR
jgi:hypothetical protein